MEQFHSKRSEQLLERLKHLEPVASSDDNDEEDYTDEVSLLYGLLTQTEYKTVVSNYLLLGWAAQFGLGGPIFDHGNL